MFVIYRYKILLYVVPLLRDGQRAETMSPGRKFDFLLERIALVNCTPPLL